MQHYSKHRNLSRAAILIAGAVTVASSHVLGAGGTWNGNTGALWSTPANWTGGVPVASEASAVIYTFGAATSANPASQMDSNWLTGRIAFTVSGYSINQPSGGSNTLSLMGTANGQAVSNGMDKVNNAINVPIVFTTGTGGSPTLSRLFDVSAGGSLALNGSINTSGGNVIKTGAGVLTLGASNTFAGGTMFGFNANNNSVVRLGTNTSLGNATLVHDNGVFTVNASANVASSGDANVKLGLANVAVPITLNNAVSLGGTGSFGLTESAGAFSGTSLMNLAGPVTIRGSKNIGVELNTVATISGQIVNGATAGGINKGNPGILVLSNANNTFSGGVVLSVGSIRVGSDTALGTGTFTGNSASTLTALSATAAGPRTFANNLLLGGTNTLQFGETGFTNNITFNGTTSLTGLNLDPGVATDDLKPLAVTGSNMVVTLGGAISEVNAGSGLLKTGAGTLVLGANNAFTGGISVSAGAVTVNGTNLSNASVGAGKLQGTGSVRVLSVFDSTADSVANGGIVSPGSDTAAGMLTASRGDFAAGGTYRFNLNDATTGAGTGWDLITLNGSGTPNGNLDVTAGAGEFTLDIDGLGTGFDASVDHAFRIVNALGVTNFSPGDFVIDSSGFTPSLNGGSFAVAVNGSNLDLVFTAVPEPTSLAVLGLGALALLRRRRAS